MYLINLISFIKYYSIKLKINDLHKPKMVVATDSSCLLAQTKHNLFIQTQSMKNALFSVKPLP